MSIDDKLKTCDRVSSAADTLKNYLLVSQKKSVLKNLNPSLAAFDWLEANDRRIIHPEQAKNEDEFLVYTIKQKTLDNLREIKLKKDKKIT